MSRNKTPMPYLHAFKTDEQTEQELVFLCEALGRNFSDIIRRAIHKYHKEIKQSTAEPEREELI